MAGITTAGTTRPRELRDHDDDEHDAGGHRADAVDDHPPLPARELLARGGTRTMPAWLSVKPVNTPTAYSGISAVVTATEDDDQDRRHHGQHDDPVREHQPVAAVLELVGQELVAGDDRATGGGSRRRRCWRPGSGWRTSRTAARSTGRSPGRRPCRRGSRAASRPPDAVGWRRLDEQRQAEEGRAEDDRHRTRASGGVLALGLLERRHAVGDRLDAGQGDGAGREGAQQHHHADPGEGGAAGELVDGGLVGRDRPRCRR